MTETFLDFIASSGFGQLNWGSLVMIGVGILFIFLAIRKGFEPLLLVPIGFGMLIGNIPYDFQSLNLGVHDGPADEAKLEYYAVDEVSFFNPITSEEETYRPFEKLPKIKSVRSLIETQDPDNPAVVMVHTEEYMSAAGNDEAPGVKEVRGGHEVFVPADLDESEAYPEDPEPAQTGDGRYRVVVKASQQDPFNASVFWFLFRGIEWGFYPPLIFLGVGSLTDFGPLLANPKTILLGAAAQFGIFAALLAAVALPMFDLQEAGAIGIIGGADGPTAIFTCTKLAPHLLGAVALSAYSYMAMVPIIQPPIMRLLTTKKERLIRMTAPRDVSKTTRILFPVAAFLLTAFIANGALPLLGMLFFGNLLRECTVTDRLAKTAQTTFIDIVTILLGLTVGAKTQASTFLTVQTIGIFVLGIFAFAVATATGLLFAKAMNAMSEKKINPLIGAAGVSAVPMAARVVQKVAHDEDRHNFLLMHAMGPNVAGVIGSAVAAGVLLSSLGGG